jgi:hypothetical protein
MSLSLTKTIFCIIGIKIIFLFFLWKICIQPYKIKMSSSNVRAHILEHTQTE